MLHTLSCSPWKCDINEMLRMIKKNDDLLLIQDGVLGAINGSRFIKMFTNASISVYALKLDVDARGITSQISSYVNIIDYTSFAYLAVKHISQICW